MRAPGGGRLLPGCGASLAERPRTPDRPSLGRAGLEPCSGGTRAPGGGRLLPGCGSSWAGRSPTPDCLSFGRAAGARYPLAVGAGNVGVVTRHQSHSPRSCELAVRAVGAVQGAWGGRLVPRCGASGVGPSPTPDLPSLKRAAGARYPLAIGAGELGVGTRHLPHSARSCKLAVRAVTAARGRPGGCPLHECGSSGVGRSPTPDRLFFGRAAGARLPLAVGRRGVGVGTCLKPHSARSCELAVRNVGAARGRPRGGVSCLGVGRPGSGALQRPIARPSGVRPGPVTHWLWVRGVMVWGPVTDPTARPPAR